MVDRQSWKDWVLIRSSLFRIQTCRLTRVPIATPPPPPSCDYTQDSPSHNNPTEMPSETTHALQFTSDPAKTGRVEKVTFIFMNQLHLCNGSDLVNVVNLKGRGRGRVRREGAAREGHERGKGGTGGSGKGGAGVGSDREGREGAAREGHERGRREGQKGGAGGSSKGGAREGQEGGAGGREGRERQGRGTRGAREGQEGVAREGQEGGAGGREGS